MPENDTDITLNLTEYEASVLTGALLEFAERWPDDAHTATYLRGLVKSQLPWED